MSPFQGLILSVATGPQGVALGCSLLPLQGGHANVETTMIHTHVLHVLNKGGRGVTSPVDSAQFHSGAVLRLRDSLRTGASDPEWSRRPKTGTTDSS